MYFLMHAHLVFVTRYRKTVFTKADLPSMHDIFNKICDDFQSRLVEFDKEKEFMHLLINYPPKISVSISE